MATKRTFGDGTKACFRLRSTRRLSLPSSSDDSSTLMRVIERGSRREFMTAEKRLDGGARGTRPTRVRSRSSEWSSRSTRSTLPVSKWVRALMFCPCSLFRAVRTAIKQEIEKAGYQNTIHLDWQKTSSEVRVMPDNRIARLFSLHIGWRILLSLVLVYPILWLLRWAFFGARYQVIRSSASLSRWVPYGATQASELDALGRTRQRAMLPTPSGQMQDFVLVGMTEEEWIAASRQRLQQAVWRGIGRSIPMRNLAMDGF